MCVEPYAISRQILKALDSIMKLHHLIAETMKASTIKTAAIFVPGFSNQRRFLFVRACTLVLGNEELKLDVTASCGPRSFWLAE
jgi:hypothetical protein